MIEMAEFRVPEEHAVKFLEDGCGTVMYVGPMPFVRKVTVSVGAPLYKFIGDLNQRFHGTFFHGWSLTRTYTEAEITAAQIFYLEMSAVFEPEGEACGTLYDESGACPLCGGGYRQVNDLHLDLRRVPKKKDIARTIADEWIVSERLAGLMTEARISGCDLRPVRQKAFFGDAPLDLRRVPSGRVSLERAQVLDLELNSPEFSQWLWAPEQRDLTEKAEAENLERLKKRYAASNKPGKWFQLVIKSPPVSLVPPTRLGIHPFEEDIEGRNRCLYAGQKDHVAGLNRLSEVSIAGSAWDGSDIICTEQLVGVKRGILRPVPLLVISPRLRRLLIEHKVKGFREEVAYLR